MRELLEELETLGKGPVFEKKRRELFELAADYAASHYASVTFYEEEDDEFDDCESYEDLDLKGKELAEIMLDSDGEITNFEDAAYATMEQCLAKDYPERLDWNVEIKEKD